MTDLPPTVVECTCGNTYLLPTSELGDAQYWGQCEVCGLQDCGMKKSWPESVVTIKTEGDKESVVMHGLSAVMDEKGNIIFSRPHPDQCSVCGNPIEEGMEYTIYMISNYVICSRKHQMPIEFKIKNMKEWRPGETRTNP